MHRKYIPAGASISATHKSLVNDAVNPFTRRLSIYINIAITSIDVLPSKNQVPC